MTKFVQDTALQDGEAATNDISGEGILPPRDDNGGDHNGGDADKRGNFGKFSSRAYSTAVTVAIISILMFFMALGSAFLVLKRSSDSWVSMRLPGILWVNTAVLLLSSLTVEMARKRLMRSDVSGFRTWWRIATALGGLFVLGQLLAWHRLAQGGVYIASNQESSFFYIFTAVHGVHLLGGIVLLLYVLLHKFDRSKLSLSMAAELSSYYWHFMTALWAFLLTLLYLGK